MIFLKKHLIQREQDNIKIDKINRLNDIKQSNIRQTYTDEQKQQISQIQYESSEHRQQLQVDLERTKNIAYLDKSYINDDVDVVNDKLSLLKPAFD